jgi:xylulose-5-phosphate/fructose-6-phosphate phosphoketolase
MLLSKRYSKIFVVVFKPNFARIVLVKLFKILPLTSLLMAKADTKKAVQWMQKYLRYTDYIAAAQLYLKDNFFLRDELQPEHFKARILGHWGTVPGLNFIYANLNYLISKHKCNMMLVTGPGHGAPSILANLYAEQTLHEFYKAYTLDGKGAGRIIKDFSWPHTPFPSHVTPGVPGSILEGGELGYSLSTAFGSVFDNPDLITAVVVGDGEAESGPIAAAWHSTKFLNPKYDGAVLPIVHINGYKISNPTIFGTMGDSELKKLMEGYGWEPLIVKAGKNTEEQMIVAMEKAYQKIRAIQKQARSGKKVQKPKWPVILMRTPKGWKGVHKYHNHIVEGSFHAHGIPIGHPKKDPDALGAIDSWLKSYNVLDLVDKKGRPKKEVMKFVPSGKLRMGMNKNAIGGNLYKKLATPRLGKYAQKVTPKKRGKIYASSMKAGGQMLRDVIKGNKKNFRLLCPDELESNKLSAVFEVTQRAYQWPLKKTDECIGCDGRVMEMLSEHTLQGWLQGYILTGRHGMLVSYEAFLIIISSMVDQYAKFLKQSMRVKWRKPVSSPVYVLSSLGWRQDHNGFSHQNPSFVSNVLQKHGKMAKVFYPSDANSLLVAFEEAMKSKDSICTIVAGKRDLPQWLSLKEAREQSKHGIGIWEWVGGKQASAKPDVVLASAGDYLTQEALFAVKLCKKLVPELKIRYVNVSELTAMGLGDYCHEAKSCLTEAGINQYFTKDRPVVFNYHGYVNDVEQLLWPYVSSDRFSIHGYREEGSTTTPFDMKVSNGVSCYHLAKDMIEQGAKRKKGIAKKKTKLLKMLDKMIAEHQSHIEELGDDPDEVKNMRW